MSRGRRRPLYSAALSMVLLALGCQGDSAGNGGRDAAPSLADVVRIDAGVDVRLIGADFSPVSDPVPVEVGDAVRTDGSGFAEVAYYEGSRTRLDVNTEFEVLELSDEAGNAVIRTRMGLGRTWQRIKAVGDSDRDVSVETSVATATVRGTAFLVACPSPNACTFTVVEGAIELGLPDGTLLALPAPVSVTVTDGRPSPPTPAPFAEVFGDAWVAENGRRDTDAGFDPPEEIYRKLGTDGEPSTTTVPTTSGPTLSLSPTGGPPGTVITFTVTGCADSNQDTVRTDGTIWPYVKGTAQGSVRVPVEVDPDGTSTSSQAFTMAGTNGPDAAVAPGEYTFELVCIPLGGDDFVSTFRDFTVTGPGAN